MRFCKTFAKTALWTIALLAVVELACFVAVRSEKDPSGTHDLLVVFQSSRNLIEQSYGLAARGLTRAICIPGLTEKTLERLDKRFGLPAAVQHFPATSLTQSTFEDALRAGTIIKSQGFREVLLVVAEHHVTRSWLLLRMETLGSGCHIRVVGIADKGKNRSRFGLWYNEGLKFWGSALEAAYYHLTGTLLTADPGLDSFFERLKRKTLAHAAGLVPQRAYSAA